MSCGKYACVPQKNTIENFSFFDTTSASSGMNSDLAQKPNLNNEIQDMKQQILNLNNEIQVMKQQKNNGNYDEMQNMKRQINNSIYDKKPGIDDREELISEEPSEGLWETNGGGTDPGEGDCEYIQGGCTEAERRENQKFWDELGDSSEELIQEELGNSSEELISEELSEELISGSSI